MQVVVKKLFRAGTVPARTWRVHSRDGSHGKVKIEEADGSSSGENEYDTPLSLFMEVSCENHCV